MRGSLPAPALSVTCPRRNGGSLCQAGLRSSSWRSIILRSAPNSARRARSPRCDRRGPASSRHRHRHRRRTRLQGPRWPPGSQRGTNPRGSARDRHSTTSFRSSRSSFYLRHTALPGRGIAPAPIGPKRLEAGFSKGRCQLPVSRVEDRLSRGPATARGLDGWPDCVDSVSGRGVGSRAGEDVRLPPPRQARVKEGR